MYPVLFIDICSLKKPILMRHPVGDDNEQADLFGLKWDTISDKFSTKPKKTRPSSGHCKANFN